MREKIYGDYRAKEAKASGEVTQKESLGQALFGASYWKATWMGIWFGFTN
jgi:hypothetical protein